MNHLSLVHNPQPLSRNAKRDLVAHSETQRAPTDNNRQRGQWRDVLVREVLAMEQQGISINAAITQLLAAIEQQSASLDVMTAAANLARGNRYPSANSIRNWVKKLQAGEDGLTDNLRGRQRLNYGWEARALELWNTPNKPRIATVAYWLEKEGFKNANYHRVRRYIQALPATLGSDGPGRIGAKQWKGKHTPYVIRDTSVLPVGFVYQGDGHTCDVYVAHPHTGNAWRPELTVWIDVRSNYVVGWMLSEAESAMTTLMSLSSAIIQHQHMPAAIHVDPGSGYRAKMITDETVGMLERASISHMEALPGNWRGKGLIEGHFNWFEERLGKRFHTYCGHARTDEYLRHLSEKVKRGLIVLPTYDQYRDAIAQHYHEYNHHPQKGLGGISPADLWGELAPVAPAMSVDELTVVRESRKVRYQRVEVYNYKYGHAALGRYEGQTVFIDIDFHDASSVVIRDPQGRFICQAEQVTKQPWLPASRLEQLAQKRADGQLKRLEKKADEVRKRARPTIDHERNLEAIERMPGGGLLIDINRMDY